MFQPQKKLIAILLRRIFMPFREAIVASQLENNPCKIVKRFLT